MRKYRYISRTIYVILLYTVILTGCSSKTGKTKLETATESKTHLIDSEIETETIQQGSQPETENTKDAAPEIIYVDWSEYFGGLIGSAVLYDPSAKQYKIYNNELALTQRSPCSTFKIISSLIALEHGILDPDQSVRTWSGEVFWNESWNQDIDFREAFRASCVWYFRKLTDDIGQDIMQQELNRLMYGNCDISDWEGRLNTNNNNRALTGFWIESSLAISPKEQTEVMERIFGTTSAYAQKTREDLKQVMLISEDNETDFPIYGKTGMGMANGVVIDAWFTGFTEKENKNVYFCIYLGKSDNEEVSSTKAKEIALKLVSHYR